MSYPRIDIQEIDSSQPTDQVLFTGTPAAVISTAQSGRAFVPTLVNSLSMWGDWFGEVSSTHWGSVAVKQWYAEAKPNSGLIYQRVLGVGDGKKRTSNSRVNRAGFVVGAEQVQTQTNYDNADEYGTQGSVSIGYSGLNPFASEVYQKTAAAAATTTIEVTNAGECTTNNTISLVTAGGDTVTITGHADTNAMTTTSGASSDGTFAAQTTESGTAGNNIIQATAIAAAITLHDDFTATSSGTATVTITQGTAGAAGNTAITLADNGGDGDISSAMTANTFADGVDQVQSSAALGRTYFLSTLMSQSAGSTYLTDAGLSGDYAPILRAVLLVASGVEMNLSGWHPGDSGGSATSLSTGSLYAWGSNGHGLNQGNHIGALKQPTGNQTCKVIFNGLIDKTAELSNRVVTVNLNPRSPGYLGGLNTDMDLLDQKGHYLYAHYPVPPTAAVPATGDSLHTFTQTEAGQSVTYYHNVLLTTGSASRNSYAGSNYAPNYEGWEDRFSTPFTPWIVSQAIGGVKERLFRLHSIDDGEGAADRYFCEISDITYPATDADFSSFTLTVRKYGTSTPLTNETKANPDVNSPILSWSGLNLDPNSTNYIARQIGDYNHYYDFDADDDEQKLVIKGLYPNTNRYFRVEVSDNVLNAKLDKDVLPFGFQGMHHLVTSGSSDMLAPLQSPQVGGADNSGETIITADMATAAQGTVAPPIPFRSTIKASQSSTTIPPWGIRFDEPASQTLYSDESEGTAISLTGNGTAGEQRVGNFQTVGQSNSTWNLIRQLNKFYPSYGGDSMWVGDNSGTANTSNGAVLDSDSHLYNAFSLGNVYVATETINSIAVPDSNRWHNARYIRDGVDPGTTGYRFLAPADLKSTTTAIKPHTRFIFPFQGGFDGLNLFNRNHREMNHWATHYEQVDNDNQGGYEGATIGAYRKAIDVLSEKTDFDINCLVIPGQRNPFVTDHALDRMEERFDAIYLLDVEVCSQQGSLDGNVLFGDNAEINSTFYSIERFAARGLDSSFGAAYFPDADLEFGSIRYDDAPASIAALGAFAKTDSREGPWGTPAGWTNGSPSSIIAQGLQIKTDDVKDLYVQRINPIVIYNSLTAPTLTDPNSSTVDGTGVISGQKTLLRADSALNRLDVRRLMVYIRRKTRDLAYKYIFEPNQPAVLSQFSGEVQSMLKGLQAAGAVDMFRVVIDDTTTSQADIENNTVRGKVFVKPRRSVEIISIDVNIQNSIE